MTSCNEFITANVHQSWHPLINEACDKLDNAYLNYLRSHYDWLPGKEKLFNAFSIPLVKTNFILFGESPYPRALSANGYAFWDNAVTDIWSPTGLTKPVNRATSLRNIIKMLLLADGLLTAQDTSQSAIAMVDKSHLVQTNDELFNNLLSHGILLLNATLVLSKQGPQKDAKVWQPFINKLLELIYEKRPSIHLILLGNIAHTIKKLSAATHYKKFQCMHPYNLSFVTDQQVIDFFKPFHLLKKS